MKLAVRGLYGEGTEAVGDFYQVSNQTTLGKSEEQIVTEFERIIPAMHIWQHACWDATYRVDQVRGITPIAPALNTLQDIYEGVDLAMAKAKVAQMFGLVFFRQAVEDTEGGRVDRTETNDADGDGLDDETGEEADDGDKYDNWTTGYRYSGVSRSRTFRSS